MDLLQGVIEEEEAGEVVCVGDEGRPDFLGGNITGGLAGGHRGGSGISFQLLLCAGAGVDVGEKVYEEGASSNVGKPIEVGCNICYRR